MPRPFLSGALVLLLLLSVPLNASPSAGAAPPPEPATMQGFLRYKVRGLSAVQGGFLSGSIMGVAAGTGVTNAARNFLRLVAGAAKLSGNASMAEMNDFLNSGKGFDFSGAPVSAGYDVELDFVLVSDGKGNYTLKSGNARYSGNTDADLTLTGDGGNVHRFTDRFRGMGTARLTGENSSISLRTEGKGKDARLHFSVDANFPVNLVGKTTWSAMGGLSVITREDNGERATWNMKAFGSEHSESSPQGQPHAGVSFGKTGPFESILRGRETWQDFTDSGVMVEWELWDQCSASIESPEYHRKLVFDESTTGRIIEPILARVQPSFWDQDLRWKFKPVSGSDVEPTPDRANGNDFDLTYTNLPPKNSEFGAWLLEAEFDTDRARKAGCRNPRPHEVSYHFTRDVDNNPGPAAWAPGKSGKKMTPNWFFYWSQTAAALGKSSRTYFDDSCENGVGGYYEFGDYIVICDLAQQWGMRFSHPWVDYLTDGIDTFGAAVVHEWKHHDDYTGWWPKGYSVDLDTDRDLIPDLLEPGMAVPAPLNKHVKYFDPDMQDTLGLGYRDLEYGAYMKMPDWKVGSANREDWACPGHQAGDDCQ